MQHFSREHHFGLLFCWKIRQGVKKDVDPERIKKYVLFFWDHHFAHHFKDEEAILFIVEQDPHCIRARAEHDQLRELMQDITSHPADTQALLLLADTVEKHIRYEERELFPHLETVLSHAQLKEIGDTLQELHAEKPTDDYADPFWLSKNGQ